MPEIFKALPDVLRQTKLSFGENEVEYVFFDLDGTLTDPGIGITNSVMHALRKMGIEPPVREELYPFIGPPLLDSFMKYYGMSEDQARLAIVYYREYFADKGLFENIPYENICLLLEKLKKQGYKLVLATSKPEPFAVKILEHFGLKEFFDFIAGSTLAETRTKKSEVIEYALESLGLNNSECKKHILMVGDRAQDVIGAHKCGIECAGVLYGYGSLEELTDCGADYVAESAV